MPEGFSIANTPLVTFRRVDLLLNGTELDTIYHSSAFSVESTGLDNQDPSSQYTKAESLFGDESFWSLSPSEYMATFLDSPPDANYGTLVVSTAGHWTTTALPAFHDEDAGESAGFGIHNVLAFFKVAMRTWAGEVQDAITKYRINGGRRPKQVVVRAYLPGHENCHNLFEPTETITPWVYTWYNWPWIPDFNTEFQVSVSRRLRGLRMLTFPSKELLSSSEFPDIHYLPIERPGRLRPDAVSQFSSHAHFFLTSNCPTSMPRGIVCISYQVAVFSRDGPTTSGISSHVKSNRKIWCDPSLTTVP